MTDTKDHIEYVSALQAARAEFEHRLRQLNDIAERNGGAHGPVAKELNQVRQNLKETEQSIKKAAAK